MKTFELSDVLLACVSFVNEPDNEEYRKAVEDIIASLVVVSYKPMQDKEVALMRVLACIKDTQDVPGMSASVEIGKIIFGLLPYAINIHDDLEYVGVQYAVYDLLYQSGIVEAILKYCKEDFDRLEHMISDAMNFSNILKLTQITDVLSEDQLKKWTQTILNMKDNLTPEAIADLKSIANSEVPEWKAFKEAVADQVLGQTLDKEVRRQVELTRDSSHLKLPEKEEKKEDTEDNN